MKNWSAIEWCLFILTLTIPLTIITVMVSRIITGEPMSPESAKLISDLLNVMIGGVLGILGASLYNKNKTI